MPCLQRPFPIRSALALAILFGASTSAVSQDATQNQTSGEHVFMQARCFACHGQFGFGTVGPRLREDRFVALGDYVVGQILVGRGIMPSFARALNDEQIAAVATYIRTSWGNNFGPVKASDVARIRQEIKLNPRQGGPHLPPSSQQPSGVPMPPNSPLPPGEALPPAQMR